MTEHTNREDYVVSAIAAGGHIRAYAATTRAMAEEARVRHDQSPVVTAALGRLMTGAAMMGVQMKEAAGKITLTVKGDGPVQMLTVDRNSLDYNVEEEERLRENIITGVVGTNEEVTTRDALNEQQIKANFESQTTVLGRVKKGFESAQKWVDETVCRLRYGAAFVSADIDYGTEFYLSTADELRERYARAKAAGSSEAELEALQRKIIATEYRNDPATLRRMAVLGELEPYAHLTRDEVINLYEKGLVPREDLLVKMNFTEYVSRFERENMDVVEFGAGIDYDKKIAAVREKLREYAAEADGARTTNFGFNSK